MAKDEPESRPIPVSELLARQRKDAAAAAETGEIPRVSFPRSANPVASRVTRDPFAGSRTASGMPSYRPAEPTDEEANRVTGIIPPVTDTPAAEPVVEEPAVDAEPAADPDAPTTGSFLRSDDDVDFESYRNFDDVIGADEEPKKRKRGLFGRRKGADDKGARTRANSARRATRPAGPSDAEPAGAAEAAAETVIETTTIPPVAPAPPAPQPVVPAPTGPEPTGPEPAAVDETAAFAVDSAAGQGSLEETTTLAPVEPDDLYEVEIPVVGKPLVDPLTGRFAAPQGDTARTRRTAPEEDGPAIVPSATRRAERRAAEASPTRGRRARRAVEASDTAIVDEAPLAAKHSPTTQWLIIIGQVIVGLVVGAAGFWGFVELWRWNPVFALILSAVVIFGIVTLVHLVRRRHDLPTTLLALGVGLLITIGPLILLATS
ncbi:DUF308 domain-containing protein [Gordonia crocea]|uniref:Uncharacterized protein n=1 Tax=Gordonia crocea TaxID=589162 RepID=A0A7I9V0N3_9ACTN|nr:DUF308 domain-containing protein [Gordonia crocea]GED99007.1 hypothetical protein nbrc107697_30460 [Gordonia crocea]